MTTGADWIDSARRLLDAVRPALDPSAAAPADARAADATARPTAHAADCRWCPVCSAAAVLRGERPEVTAALADVLATTAAVLRDLAGEPDRPSAPQADAPAADRPQDAGADPFPVQRIDIA